MEREVFYTLEDDGWYVVYVACGHVNIFIERHETEAQAQAQCDELDLLDRAMDCK